MRRLLIPFLVILIGAVTLWQRQMVPGLPAPAEAPAQGAAPARLDARGDLPAEAWETLERIERGGPFPHRQDGNEFQNREELLPAAARGYYHEYTVRIVGTFHPKSRETRLADASGCSQS